MSGVEPGGAAERCPQDANYYILLAYRAVVLEKELLLLGAIRNLIRTRLEHAIMKHCVSFGS